RPGRRAGAAARRRASAGGRRADRPGRRRAAPPRRTRPGGPAAGRVAADRGAREARPAAPAQEVGVSVDPRQFRARSLGALLALGFLLAAAPAAAVEVTFPLTIGYDLLRSPPPPPLP